MSTKRPSRPKTAAPATSRRPKRGHEVGARKASASKPKAVKRIAPRKPDSQVASKRRRPPTHPEGWDAASTVVVVNTAAAGGRVGREWRTLALDLAQALGDVRFVLSRAPGHAIELAAEAVRDGARTILSLGGDGTHNEVVNGILRAQRRPGEVRLGILPAGTGGDFRRLLVDGKTLHESARAMPTASVAPIDAGRVSFVTDEGKHASRFFVNIASLGVGGLVDRAVNRSSKRLGGKAAFLLATLQTLPTYRPPRVRLRVDGDAVGDFTITNIAVCNGRFAGGSMMLAPEARLGDGLFDVTVMRHAPLLRSLPEAPRLYDGTILDSSDVEFFQGRHVRVEPLDARKAYMDIDGEAPGVAPAEFEMLHHALRLIGARPDVL